MDGPSDEIPAVVEYLEQASAGLFQDARRLHDDYDAFFATQVATNPNITAVQRADGTTIVPTYHNWYHVQSVLDCWKDIAANYRNGVDIFNIQQHIKEYKEQLGDEYTLHKDQWDAFFSGNDWITAMNVAFAGHDLGNITEDATFKEGGTVTHSSVYLQEGAEQRSITLTEQLIEKHFRDYQNRDQMKRFVADMITHTIYNPQDEQPEVIPAFWTLVQTVDQVGSTYYNSQNYALVIAGLLNEFQARGESTEHVMPARYLMFPIRRLHQLLGYSDEAYYQYIEFLKKHDPEKYNEVIETVTILEDRYDRLEYSRHITDIVHKADERKEKTQV